MNWSQLKDPVSHMCLAGAVVSNARDGRLEPFDYNEKFSVT